MHAPDDKFQIIGKTVTLLKNLKRHTVTQYTDKQSTSEGVKGGEGGCVCMGGGGGGLKKGTSPPILKDFTAPKNRNTVTEGSLIWILKLVQLVCSLSLCSNPKLTT